MKKHKGSHDKVKKKNINKLVCEHPFCPES